MTGSESAEALRQEQLRQLLARQGRAYGAEQNGEGKDAFSQSEELELEDYPETSWGEGLETGRRIGSGTSYDRQKRSGERKKSARTKERSSFFSGGTKKKTSVKKIRNVKIKPEPDEKRKKRERAQTQREPYLTNPQPEPDFKYTGPAGDGAVSEKNAKSRRNTGNTAGKLFLQGAVGVLVILTRIMQLVSCLAMAGMTVCLAHSFWNGRAGLGSIQAVAAERNYGLALYLATAGVILFFGVIWSFWILTRKAAGGEIRLKSYDTGRGFFPFLFWLAGLTALILVTPHIPSDGAAWRGLAGGAKAVSAAVLIHKELLIRCSALGAVLSLIRKIIRV